MDRFTKAIKGTSLKLTDKINKKEVDESSIIFVKRFEKIVVEELKYQNNYCLFLDRAKVNYTGSYDDITVLEFFRSFEIHSIFGLDVSYLYQSNLIIESKFILYRIYRHFHR